MTTGSDANSPSVEPSAIAVVLTKRPLLVLVVLATIFALPVLLYGPLPQAHDRLEHINYSQHFTSQFWSGEWYPRWLAGLNHGLGSPAFFVFPPLPFYLAALIEPLARILRINALNACASLSLILSGIFAYLWLSRRFCKIHALIAASLYMILPYHLALNFYRRFALPESWALAWIPLLFYFVESFPRRTKHALAGIAITYALLIFSHAISAAMVFPIAVGLVLVHSSAKDRIRDSVLVIASLFLGIGISAIYMLPALVHEKYIRPATLLNSYHYQSTDNLLTIGRRLLPGSINYSFTSTATWVAFDMILLLALCALMIRRSSSKLWTTTARFWVAVSVLAIFVMSELSYPLWKWIPQLTEAIQFPWRFNIILCVAMAPILAACLSLISSIPHSRRRAMNAFICANVLLWLAMWAWECSRYRVEKPFAPDLSRMVDEFDGWFAAWAPANLDQQSAVTATSQPSCRLAAGEGSVQVIRWKPRAIEVLVCTPAGGTLAVNQFFYPAWRARTPEGANLPILPPARDGLLRVNVPPGKEEVTVSIPYSASERIGLLVTLASLLLCSLVAVYKRPITGGDQEA